MGTGLRLVAQRVDGVVVPVEISLSPLATDDGPMIICVLRDISARVRLEEASRESEQRYRSLVEMSPEAIVVHTLGTIVYVNDASVRLFSVGSREDLLGRSFLEFVPPEYMEEVRDRVEHPSDPEHPRGPLLIRTTRPDGSTIVLEAIGARVAYQGSPAGQVILRDISDRVKAEEELKSSREQLRNLSTYLQNAREAERTSVAREIHDEFGGTLTALKMDLAGLDDLVTEGTGGDFRAAFLERVESMAALIDGTVKTMRRIITDLRPVLLDSLGLGAAMEWQAEEFETRTGITCAIRGSEGDLRLDRDRATAVFRIFQETLTNVARHARASRVDVDLAVDGGRMTLCVRDNGIGIGDERRAGSTSFGILGMRERAILFGGEVTIVGTPGMGTAVTLVIPIAGDGTHGGAV
jgi:PAS domain S-box-containing protein